MPMMIQKRESDFSYYSPSLKKWGLYRIGMSVIPSVHLSVCHNFVSAQYLEHSFIEFIQILYVH